MLDGHALLAESRHRHANAYQCILAVIARELGRASQPETIDALMKADLQIRAFALLNQLLDAAPEPERHQAPCAAGYLRRLCDQLAVACLTPGGVALHFAGEEPQYHLPDYCRNFGLITTELVLNASKHAFAGRDDGAVHVSLLDNDPCVTQLIVADNGCGVEHFTPAPRRGLGFVQLLATSMGGRCSGYSCTEGTRIEITVPRSA